MQPLTDAPPPSWPLDDNDLKLFDSILDHTPTVIAILQKCKDCGMPCEEQIATLQEQMRLAAAFKAKFFPNAT